jgi:hypothetical protein
VIGAFNEHVRAMRRSSATVRGFGKIVGVGLGWAVLKLNDADLLEELLIHLERIREIIFIE